MTKIRLNELTPLFDAVRIIRAVTPNTGNAASFRQGLADLSDGDMMQLCRSIDAAGLAADSLQRHIVIEVATEKD